MAWTKIEILGVVGFIAMLAIAGLFYEERKKQEWCVNYIDSNGETTYCEGRFSCPIATQECYLFVNEVWDKNILLHSIEVYRKDWNTKQEIQPISEYIGVLRINYLEKDYEEEK